MLVGGAVFLSKNNTHTHSTHTLSLSFIFSFSLHFHFHFHFHFFFFFFFIFSSKKSSLQNNIKRFVCCVIVLIIIVAEVSFFFLLGLFCFVCYFFFLRDRFLPSMKLLLSCDFMIFASSKSSVFTETTGQKYQNLSLLVMRLYFVLLTTPLDFFFWDQFFNYSLP